MVGWLVEPLGIHPIQGTYCYLSMIDIYKDFVVFWHFSFQYCVLSMFHELWNTLCCFTEQWWGTLSELRSSFFGLLRLRRLNTPLSDLASQSSSFFPFLSSRMSEWYIKTIDQLLLEGFSFHVGQDKFHIGTQFDDIKTHY